MFVSPDLSLPAFRRPAHAIILAQLFRTLRLSDLLILPLLMRIFEVIVAFEQLFNLWREGRLAAADQRPQEAQPQPLPPAATQHSNALPRRFAGRAERQPETSVYAAKVQERSADPEIAALLAKAPQADKYCVPSAECSGFNPARLPLSRYTPLRERKIFNALANPHLFTPFSLRYRI